MGRVQNVGDRLAHAHAHVYASPLFFGHNIFVAFALLGNPIIIRNPHGGFVRPLIYRGYRGLTLDIKS